MVKGKSRIIKHLNNQEVHLWLLGHGPEDLKMGCIPVSLVWRNLYWECGCAHGYGAQPRCAVWVCIWDKQFYTFLFWDFIKPFGLKFLYSLSNTSPLRDWTGKYFIKSQNGRLLRELEACSAMPSYVTSHWSCSSHRLWQNRARGIAPAAFPRTTIVPGLRGLLVARDAILTGWVLTRTSICSAVPHCLLAIACKQLSADFTMPMAVLLLHHPIQLRVDCYYLSVLSMVCVAASGAFYLQSPSSRQTTFIFMQREEILASCKYIIFLYEERGEEAREKCLISDLLERKLWVLPL